MAAPRKKRVDEGMVDLQLGERGEAEGTSDVEEEDMQDFQDSPEELVDEEIQVEFEARTPEDSDIDGIKKLLQQLFLKANINLSQLTDTILGQNYVGSVIKQVPPSDEDDDDDMDDDSDRDVFGVITCINITEKQDLDCVKQIKSMLLSKCEQCSAKQKDKLAQLLSNEAQVGLLLSERFINIPAQIALPSYENLWKELEKAVKKNMKYTFSHFLMICKTYRLPPTAGKKKKKAEAGPRTFQNSEEEYFFDEAALAFDYSVKHERDTVVGGMWDDETEEFEPFRTVIIVDSEQIPKITKRMRETLAMPQP